MIYYQYNLNIVFLVLMSIRDIPFLAQFIYLVTSFCRYFCSDGTIEPVWLSIVILVGIFVLRFSFCYDQFAWSIWRRFHNVTYEYWVLSLQNLHFRDVFLMKTLIQKFVTPFLLDFLFSACISYFTVFYETWRKLKEGIACSCLSTSQSWLLCFLWQSNRPHCCHRWLQSL